MPITYRLAALLTFVLCLMVVQTVAKPTMMDIERCSRNLADHLMYICKDRGYNSPQFQNDRQEIDPSNPAAMMMDLSIDDNYMSEKMPGIVNECCRKVCSPQTWESYCASPPSP